jgi:menaquinone-dependent protoporphyrinogen oxidase
MKILVAYASKNGSTAEIAEAIAEVLRQRGHPCDVLSVDALRSLGAYQAVVLGSAVYSGHWMKEAVHFLRSHQFSELPLFIFSSGPIGDAKDDELREAYPLPEVVQTLSQNLNLRDVQVFHGKIDLRKLSLAELMLFKSVGAQTGDYRKWDRIKLWAHHISDSLVQSDV